MNLHFAEDKSKGLEETLRMKKADHQQELQETEAMVKREIEALGKMTTEELRIKD
jgi:uncharacterized protein (UPF0335 family)